MCFTPLSKTAKLLVLSGITPYRIVSISILYSKVFLFLFSSYSIFKSLYRRSTRVFFAFSWLASMCKENLLNKLVQNIGRSWGLYFSWCVFKISSALTRGAKHSILFSFRHAQFRDCSTLLMLLWHLHNFLNWFSSFGSLGDVIILMSFQLRRLLCFE